VQSKHEFWEDPDDGSDSENEYEGEEEDGIGNDLDNESDWEDDSRVQKLTTTDNYEEELAKEVEQLLEPEERVILQQNEKPNLKMISTKSWKPLQTLALSMQIQLMDNLIENGLDIDDVDKDNQTALHKAIIGKKEAVISHLLRKGANPHLQDRDGAAPIHYAVQVGALQTVKLLFKYNVDVNVADNEGWTPLHIAVQSRNRDITKILLTNGADKTRRTKDGKLALDLALCFGRDFKSYDLVKLLKIMPTGDI
jgi:hypothetical protein